METITSEYGPGLRMEGDGRTVKDDNARSSTELLLDLSKRFCNRIGVRDVNGDRNQTLLLKRFPRPDGNLISFLLQLVRDGETDTTSGTEDESGWRHCTGRNAVCLLWVMW